MLFVLIVVLLGFGAGGYYVYDSLTKLYDTCHFLDNEICNLKKEIKEIKKEGR